LPSIILKNPKKSVLESLQILVTKLCNLKGSFTLRLQSDKFLYNKILIACYSILAYAIALVRPLLDISNLINKLNFAIIIYKAEYLLENETFFTD
jgi:intracellular septation protein A